MDKIFSEMFSRQPDEVFNGDYFYHLPYYEKWGAELREMVGGVSLNEVHKRQENRMKNAFKFNWLRGEANPFLYDPFFKGKEDIDFIFEETIRKIARDGRPFMDIASWEDMGLAPYIIKMNPEIPCLVTDIDAYTMKQLRLCINENLFGYNINIASFDNFDIPIKDKTLDYITSWHGVTNSCTVGVTDSCKASVREQGQHIYQYSVGQEKVIDEIYRILKPGGRFVSLEMNRECDYNLQRLYNNYNEHGRLFGVYTYDEIQAVCELLTEEPWRDKFISAGFRVEAEKTQLKKSSLRSVINFLHGFTDYHGIHHREKANRGEQDFLRTIKDSDTENIGFDLYETDTFFVLRKPE
ncbi:MAG: class I SAM-dependent methyltransferase [Eubacteriales bacterium]|jgi:SAM-dependent methyltransferase|nr:class I SAM-dependent methyltransferase [Eubacteriales bacterium]